MATRIGDSVQAPVELSSDSESEAGSSSSSGSDRAPRRGSLSACAWRTTRFHDQECSRYFDCPTHLIERVLSDSEEGGRQGQAEDVDMDDAPDQPDPGAVSPLSDTRGEDAGEERGRPRSPSPELPEAASSSAHDDTRHVEAPERTSSLSTPTVFASTSTEMPQERPRRDDSENPAPSHRYHNRNALPEVFVPPRLPRTGGVEQRTSHTMAPERPSPLPDRTGLGELVLPRWQPDAEVTYCPICQTQFSIWIRKHHCRKCGRVVCATCSPHRITIPYQYIVQPPGTPALMASPSDQGGNSYFGGGAKVRLCNPCVPDPNTAPPQTQGVHTPRADPETPDSVNSAANRWSFYFGASPAVTNNAHARSRSVTMGHEHGASSSHHAAVPYPQNTEHRILSGTPPVYYPSTSTSRQRQPYPGPARYRSMLDIGDRPGPSSSAAGPSSSRQRRLPPTPPAQPQLAEEDECPVCHRELPPRTLPNYESLREAHINICISSHSTYSGGVPASVAGSTAENPLPPMPPRRTGMFPYTATEKDCVDSAECTICLEEFEVGVAMARLECLCRFHRSCIAAWWERHPGRCPMHQHDGMGY
ncbi:putative E3 ubiquitin-protein ligase ZNRF2 [Podospora australis]|uniref:E3 ubiquitin-protein ligase ZNRF2 n=1 Tax=Podospora australis TaxID=1536484 RepID=A0AAN6WQB1_9PEZI|nr:putative E3 ubiquitin-protein ligase ZNRF2 [Podospora australis]